MTDASRKALLPAGLQDLLPPDAAREAAAIEASMDCLAAHGYDRVKPPLIEFEESLLAGPGAAMAPQTFRLMDPVSQRMMGVRADITVQIARIAESRLHKAARPLRLCYAGEVLRVKGDALRPERQFAQVGAELIGAGGPAADAEIILLAVEALERMGVQRLSVDIAMPRIVPGLLETWVLEPEVQSRLAEALDRKDAGGVAAALAAGPDDEPRRATLTRLLQSTGPAEAALDALAAIDADPVREGVGRLRDVLTRIRAVAPELAVTIDPVETRGFRYQTGLCFTLFARDVRGELGRGGAYVTGMRGEPATGFTLYMDSVMRAAPDPEPARRLYVPHGEPAAAAAKLRQDGWVTVAGLDPAADPAEDARRLACTHVLRGGRAVSLAHVDGSTGGR